MGHYADLFPAPREMPPRPGPEPQVKQMEDEVYYQRWRDGVKRFNDAVWKQRQHQVAVAVDELLTRRNPRIEKRDGQEYVHMFPWSSADAITLATGLNYLRNPAGPADSNEILEMR
jgi:hypothetical protein